MRLERQRLAQSGSEQQFGSVCSVLPQGISRDGRLLISHCRTAALQAQQGEWRGLAPPQSDRVAPVQALPSGECSC